LGFPGVNAVDDLRVLAEHALGKALGVAIVGGVLGPSAAVWVQTYLFDAQPLAPLLELRCTIRIPHGDEIIEAMAPAKSEPKQSAWLREASRSKCRYNWFRLRH
jgi:hypothetical protein